METYTFFFPSFLSLFPGFLGFACPAYEAINVNGLCVRLSILMVYPVRKIGLLLAKYWDLQIISKNSHR